MTVAIKNDFVVILVLDDRRGCRWVRAIGTRKGIDKIFEWCVANLKRDDTRWLSILSHHGDAIVLDMHFFEEISYNKFFFHYEKFYVEED